MMTVTEKAEINEIVSVLQKLDEQGLQQMLISSTTLAAYQQLATAAENKKTA